MKSVAFNLDVRAHHAAELVLVLNVRKSLVLWGRYDPRPIMCT